MNTIPNTKPLFELGYTVCTLGARDALSHNDMQKLLRRHAVGDWGNLCDEDKKMNNNAVCYGGRIFSSYTVNEVKVWVITEYDRSVTTILLPSEY